MDWNGFCLIFCITLKELWTRVSSRSMTMHFFPASCGRMAGSRGFWPGDTGATWGAADELQTQYKRHAHPTTHEWSTRHLHTFMYLHKRARPQEHLFVTAGCHRPFCLFRLVPCCGKIHTENLCNLVILAISIRFKNSKNKKPKMEGAYLLDDSFWSVTSELDEGCFEEPLLV